MAPPARSCCPALAHPCSVRRAMRMACLESAGALANQPAATSRRRYGLRANIGRLRATSTEGRKRSFQRWHRPLSFLDRFQLDVNVNAGSRGARDFAPRLVRWRGHARQADSASGSSHRKTHHDAASQGITEIFQSLIQLIRTPALKRSTNLALEPRAGIDREWPG